MKEKLIELGFEMWLGSVNVYPYPAIFWDAPKFIQNSYIQKFLRDVYSIGIFVVACYVGEDTHRYSYYIVGADDLDTNSDGSESFTYEDALETALQEGVKLIE